MRGQTGKLTAVELTALQKLTEQQLKECKTEGQTIVPGNHSFDFTVTVSGSLARGQDTKVAPRFSMNEHLKQVLLHYANAMQEGADWLQAILSMDGVLGAVVRQGSKLKSVDPALEAIWSAAETAAKENFQAMTPKDNRAGNTTVVGDLLPVAAVTSAAKRGKSST